jgi:hypothetical protein
MLNHNHPLAAVVLHQMITHSKNHIMKTKLFKIAFLSVMFLALSQASWAQKKTVVVEKSNGDKKKTTSTIVLKVTKDENGKITTIDTTFTSDKTADSVEYAITQTFDFDSDGMKNLDKEITAMIKEFKIDSLGRLSETIDFDIDTDPNQPCMPQAPCCPPFPQGYSYNYNWDNFPNQWNLQQFLNDNIRNKSVKIKTRRVGKGEFHP